jgi:hypothetical protein
MPHVWYAALLIELRGSGDKKLKTRALLAVVAAATKNASNGGRTKACQKQGIGIFCSLFCLMALIDTES